MKLPAVVPLILFAAATVHAQPVPVPKPAPADSRVPVRLDPLTLEAEVRTRVDAFFTVLKQRNVDMAYRRLLDNSVLAKENPDLVTKLVDSTTRVLELTGRVDGAEILKVRAAGRTLREVTCVLIGEKRPIRWKFYFYLADGKWQVLDTNVATEADGFFEPEP